MDRRPRTRQRTAWKPARLPEIKPLLEATDNGHPVVVPAQRFASPRSGSDWGPYAETFLRLNEEAFKALGARGQVVGTSFGQSVQIVPGARAGAIPLKSAVTDRVAGGLLVRSRFGWNGIGRLLCETGWHASPQLLPLATVPGSAREVPAWVLAGPILARLERLLKGLRPGYTELETTLLKPRGRILWESYVTGSLVHGRWERLPCRFPDLSKDPVLRRYIRWTLESVLLDLHRAGRLDPVAQELAELANLLIRQVVDVLPLAPRRDDLRRGRAAGLLSKEVYLGLEAMMWVIDERGLGGGNERDGLSWALSLDGLWEHYVESVYRREAASTGGEVFAGRLGQTLFPLHWTDPMHRTLGHLIPDLMVRRGSSVNVVDAKYKAHLAEVDEVGWNRFEDEIRDSHRSDIHQVLAYASLYEADDITATLVYPLRLETYLSLRDKGHDRSYADLMHGGRTIRLELRGLPFGSPHAPH